MKKHLSRCLFLLIIGISSCCSPFCKSEKNVAKIPIRFISPAKPVMKVEIEDIACLLEVDLGFAEDLSIMKEILNKIRNKAFIGTKKFFDIKGNQYETLQYKIPQLKINSFLKLTGSITAKEESLYFLTKGAVLEEPPEIKVPPQIDGRIGRRIFMESNCLFDFPHSAIFIFKDTQIWKKKNFIEVPFEIGKFGIILSAEMDCGTRKLILDTGASCSILRKSGNNKKTFFTKKLVISNHDFGKWDFHLFDITSLFDEFDGILGVDFFKRYAIYFDFKNNRAFIHK